MSRQPTVPRRVAFVVALLVLAALTAGRDAGAQSSPNIVLLNSDDYGWTYYGFIQRYLRAKTAPSTCANNGSISCTRDDQCPGSYCLVDLIGEDISLQGKEYNDPQIILPDDHDSLTPDIDRLLTPALDALASADSANGRGYFFPVAHTGASVCKPGLATTMTGLYLSDLVDGTNATDDTKSPVIPEWLPTSYLTMIAGKWEYGVSHVNADLSEKLPFDRDMPKHDGSGDSSDRAMLTPYDDAAFTTPALERVKDFIDCAQCSQSCGRACMGGSHLPCSTNAQCGANGPCVGGTNLGRPCATQQAGYCSPGICRAVGATCGPPPTTDMDPDKTRLTDRNNATCTGAMQPRACCTGPGTGTCCQTQPFFVMLQPFVPHLQYRFSTYCPYFPRTETQCADEPYHTNSPYCQMNPVLKCEYLDSLLGNFGNAVPPDGLIIENIRHELNRDSDVQFLRAKSDYLLFANVFDRAVDELVVYLKDRSLMSNTAMLYTTDNGFGLDGSKAAFSEHGFRTPIILFDPHPVMPAPPASPRCGGQPGCRNEFAHDIDILATIRDLAGSPGSCAGPPPVGPCPSRGEAAYAEARDLRNPPTIARSCGTVGTDGRFLQCLFGRRKGTQSLDPDDGWYVVAEIAETSGPVHLCKYYRACSSPPKRYFDLRNDPNENKNLNGVSNPPFCGSTDIKTRLDTILANFVQTRSPNGEWSGSCFP